MDFPALVGSASIVVDSGTKKAGCQPGRNMYSAFYNFRGSPPWPKWYMTVGTWPTKKNCYIAYICILIAVY